MTAALDDRPTAPAPARPTGRGPHGLAWLMWRQHRAVLWCWLVLLLLAAVAAPVLRAQMTSYIADHHIAGCAEISTNASCQDPGQQNAVMVFRDHYGLLLKAVGALLLLLPAGLGAILGAPLLAQELERGTWKLVLTQSVGRDRWVMAKLLSAALIGAIGSGLLALLYRWLWQPSANDVSGIAWYSTVFFSSGGPVLVASVLLALSAGALTGALLRRVLPAMAASVGVVGLLQYGLATLRPHLWGWHTELIACSELPNDVWGFAQGFLTPDGHRLPYDICATALLNCPAEAPGTREFTDVHLAADYWPLQLVESGICLALAAALTVATIAVVRRRRG
ncbi:ABC transporter permease [Kitasatospora sp. NPDC052896]|uniref:ABC transporter permease n=1 Tax=Kitasatospora sp. NPDC052896 TaxID=3364061 RepID=UPI0037CC4180